MLNGILTAALLHHEHPSAALQEDSSNPSQLASGVDTGILTSSSDPEAEACEVLTIFSFLFA